MRDEAFLFMGWNRSTLEGRHDFVKQYDYRSNKVQLEVGVAVVSYNDNHRRGRVDNLIFLY